MIVLMILAASAIGLALGGRFYAPLIGRVLDERRDRTTPAVAIDDGRDYVPTQTPVVFAHHYASIAGAGPIVGPVLAILYGWGPALLWILLGGIFLGAVHDYIAAHIALREGGKNLTVIARRHIGPAAFVMLLVLLVLLLVLVCAAFLDLSAKALTSMVSLDVLKMSPEQTLFRVAGGKAVIGGIASTSVVVITACSPLIGFLYLKRKTPVWICSLLAIVICAVSILVGLRFPMSVEPVTWKLMISGYVLISAGLPVWLFLQSRDFINVHVLYLGIAFLVVGVVAAAIRGGGHVAETSGIPLNNWTEASRQLGPGWPVMFVVIACGAVSGFHGLCAGGTTCKQLTNEPAARRVGYYAMLLESFLAVCVVCCLIIGLSLVDYKGLCYPVTGNRNAVLTFAMAVGHTTHIGLGMPIWAGALGAMLLLEGFLVTTLDTAIRLTRYMIEEGWATFFGRYDVFAQARAQTSCPTCRYENRVEAMFCALCGSALAPSGTRPGGPSSTVTTSTAQSRVRTGLTGTGGSGVEAPGIFQPALEGPIVETRGSLRVFLELLRHYWVNSGIAVALMLILGLGNGYLVLWKIFGSTNQLLAALTLLIGSCWLLIHRRPVWFTLLPSLFMLVTSLWMLVRLIVQDRGNWSANVPLVVTEFLVLAMTVGIVTMVIVRWRRMLETDHQPPKGGKGT